MVSDPLSFLQEYFHSALASSVYYLTISKYSWENFHSTLKNCERLAQRIFPLLCQLQWICYNAVKYTTVYAQAVTQVQLLLAALCDVIDIFYCTQSDLTRFTGNMKYPLLSRKATAIKLAKGGNGFVFAIFHNGKEYAVKNVKRKVHRQLAMQLYSYIASSLKSYMEDDCVYTQLHNCNGVLLYVWSSVKNEFVAKATCVPLLGRALASPTIGGQQ